jgi:fatty-acyl-CoA synthase
MIDLFMLAVSRYPNNIAMRDETSEVTYSELAGIVSAATKALSDMGVARGNGVAQMAGNGIVAWAVQVSCYALGARYVGVHRRTSLADARYIIADSGVETIVVDETLHPAWLGEFSAGIDAVKYRLSHGATRMPGWVSIAEQIDRTPPKPQLSRAYPEDIARLAYTGGTTGRPKGVVLPHRTLVATTLLTRGELVFGAETRTLLTAPISHGAGNMIMPTLLRGGYIRLDNNFSAETFLATVREEKITTTFLVPTMIYALLDHPGLAAADLSNLQLVRYGAAPISPDRLDEALSVFGPTMQQVYGQTEAPSAIATLLPSDHVHGSPRLASIGTPFAGVRVALLNKAGDEVQIGQVGEICVRGPVVMRGYWNLPDETAHVFRGGWLHTGDMAVSDKEGYLFIVDRAKDMIITGGFNVYSREIEDVLCKHPEVASAAVFGIPDSRWGEAVTAAVVRRRSAGVSTAELMELVRSQKGPVASPKRIEFIDALPMTAVGKVDKPALRARYQDGGSQKGDDLWVRAG